MERVIKKSLTGILGFSLVAGCISNPYQGKSGMLAGSAQHCQLVSQNVVKGSVDKNAEAAILNTFLDNSEHQVTLDNGVEFYTKRLSSGSYVAVWDGSNNTHAVIMCNGLGSDCLDSSKLAQYCAQNGIDFYAIDRTGSGLNSRMKASSNSWKKDILDIAKELKTSVLVGQCFSTGLAAEVAFENPDLFSKVVYVTPCFYLNYGVGLNAVPIGINHILGGDCAHENPVPIRAYSSRKDTFTYLAEDPLFLRSPTTETYIEGHRLNNRAWKNIVRSVVPVEVILAENDVIVNNQKTKKHLSYLDNPNVHVNMAFDVEHYIPLDEKSYGLYLEVIKNEQ